MSRLLKNIGLLILTVLAIYGSLSIYRSYKSMQGKEEISSTVLLERIEKVMKLVTVEGAFSEIYDYKHSYFADIWPFRKKALVRINAKVAVGYDFEAATIHIDDDNKIITISNFPPPEVLSIDHNVESYNFTNGLFNMITDKDIAIMNDKAKQYIADQAKESDLFEKAEEQKDELLKVLMLASQASGWTLEIGEDQGFRG